MLFQSRWHHCRPTRALVFRATKDAVVSDTTTHAFDMRLAERAGVCEFGAKRRERSPGEERNTPATCSTMLLPALSQTSIRKAKCVLVFMGQVRLDSPGVAQPATRRMRARTPLVLVA